MPLKSDAASAPTRPALPTQNHPPPDANDVTLDGDDAEQSTPQDGDDLHRWPETDVLHPAPDEMEPMNADNFPPLPSEDDDDEPQNPVVSGRPGRGLGDARILFTMWGRI